MQKCATWLTDNTAYMSGHVNGAIVKFNKLANSNSIRIGSGLHIINIVFTNFKNEAFGRVSGVSRKPHPFNFLYLTWHLHDGYGNNNSGAPMNIKSDYIQDLYKALIGYCHSQYQMPLQTRWEELLEALELLNEIEFGEIFDSLEKGMKKALLHFEKWIIQWLKLPLSVCRLGGNYAQSFTRSFRHVILDLPTVFEPSKREAIYIRQLENDLKENISNDFGLKTLYTSDPNFREQFNNFCDASNPELPNYPLLYEFVTTKIYYIIVHQQQVEGMCNKLDLKTHPNMSLDLKESKLRLSETRFSKKDIKDGIVSIRQNRKKEKKRN
ncbi:hypothetical protein C2G38_2042420 [Gigaspora rosea]|uniref:Uncharacterized protein n=1 Tax=Gigaspora rosea TaxID=44941 RepID=A0A397UND8_9GLOM|nr:hypothetical protein C2G38_2042420 [Gigaspora rosea]